MSKSTNISEIKNFIENRNNIQFLSANEPLTTWGVNRILAQLYKAIDILEQSMGAYVGIKSITEWSQTYVYSKNDVVLWQKSRFSFILVSTKDNNTSIPNYDLTKNGIPDFEKSNWSLVKDRKSVV